MNDVAVDSALASVKSVVFASSTEKSQTIYDDWSNAYDEHMVILGSSYAPEAGKMFEKYGRDCKVMLDLGAGMWLLVHIFLMAKVENLESS